jgi:hypothetical protein
MTRIVIIGEIYNADLSIGGGPIPPSPGQPPGIWGGAPPYVDIGGPGWQPRPSHPIAPGGRPPGIWGGPPLYPDIGGPGSQPGPSHPWVPPGPGQPPGYWGGVAPPYPDQGLPGSQPHPSHPIAPGGQPPGYWGGVAPPFPAHPMVPPTETVWVIGYAEGYGPTWVKVRPVEPDERPPEGTEPAPEPTPQA